MKPNNQIFNNRLKDVLRMVNEKNYHTAAISLDLLRDDLKTLHQQEIDRVTQSVSN